MREGQPTRHGAAQHVAHVTVHREQVTTTCWSRMARAGTGIPAAT